MSSLSVVVPVLNAVRTLPLCLSALARLDPPPEEILFVDNASSDNSFRLMQVFADTLPTGRVRVLQESRRGAAAARNAGIRAAHGELIAFTDADCAPEVSWLRPLISQFSEAQVAAVAGRVVPAPPVSTVELFSALYTLSLPAHPSRHRHWSPWEGGFPTANLTVRRSVLESLGGFDESLTIYGEDYDLCARIYERGLEIAYIPEAQVAHHHRTTLRGMLRQAFGFGRGHPLLLRRHAQCGLWLTIPRKAFRWPGCPVRAWIDLASADKKALAILGLAAAYPPALWLLPVLAVWLTVTTGRRARQAGTRPSPAASVELAALLLLKSAAMTAGRWWGSLKYGALCF
jgi:GT2 family glycosyltransferase